MLKTCKCEGFKEEVCFHSCLGFLSESNLKGFLDLLCWEISIMLQFCNWIFFPSPRLPHNLVANFPDYRELQTSQLLKYPQGRNLWATVNKPPHAADLWLTVNKPLALTTALMFLSSCRKGIFILERRIKAFQDKKITLCSVINCPDFLGHLEKDHNKVFQIQHGKCPCTWCLPASFRAAPSIYMLRMSISLLTVWYRDFKKKRPCLPYVDFPLELLALCACPCSLLHGLKWFPALGRKAE